MLLEGSVTSIDSTAVFFVAKILAATAFSLPRMITLKKELLQKVTKTCRALYGTNIQSGTKSEMQQLEHNFVAEFWIPSFLQNQEPKKQKEK